MMVSFLLHANISTPKLLESALEHQWEHATCSDLDIIEDSVFVYTLFDTRDKSPFFIVRMPSPMFYGSIFSEFLRIAWCTLSLTDFMPKASQLYTRMVTQGGNKASMQSQIKKTIPKISWNILQVL